MVWEVDGIVAWESSTALYVRGLWVFGVIGVVVCFLVLWGLGFLCFVLEDDKVVRLASSSLSSLSSLGLNS